MRFSIQPRLLRSKEARKNKSVQISDITFNKKTNCSYSQKCNWNICKMHRLWNMIWFIVPFLCQSNFLLCCVWPSAQFERRKSAAKSLVVAPAHSSLFTKNQKTIIWDEWDSSWIFLLFLDHQIFKFLKLSKNLSCIIVKIEWNETYFQSGKVY